MSKAAHLNRGILERRPQTGHCSEQPDGAKVHGSDRRTMRAKFQFTGVMFLAILIAVPIGAARPASPEQSSAQEKPSDGRTLVKPGIDRYSVEQDVQLGRGLSRQVEKQMPLLNDRRVDDYLNDLGQRLAAHAPGPDFHYEFRCVNSREINAFALPGGFVFVYRGSIETAVNEAQLAGIIAHEISHVALRHGTNQATKAEIWGAVGAIGGMVAGGSAAGIASQIGGNLAINATLLKYSRTAETQADVVGTQILHDAGYDSRALGQFFEQLSADAKRKQPVEFFADHPNYEHRLDRINEEVDKMSGPPENYVRDSQEFREIRRYLLSLAPPPVRPKRGTAVPSDPAVTGKPERPSQDTREFSSDDFRARYPDNWELQGTGDSISFVPPRGIVTDSAGGRNTAYGILVNREKIDASATLADATNQIVANIQQSNPRATALASRDRIRVDGEPALRVTLLNDSPAGGQEKDLLIAVILPNDATDSSPGTWRETRLLYFICVAPTLDFDDYNPTFQEFIASIRFNR